MGCISMGTLTLSQQQHINTLIKNELIFISEYLKQNDKIVIISENTIYNAVLIKLCKLVTSSIIITDEDTEIAINFNSISNNLMKDWFLIDINNYLLHY